MARAPRKKKTDTLPLGIQALGEALDFANHFQRGGDSIAQSHCRFGFNTLTAFDGILSCGIVVEHELIATPHTAKFRAALARCKSDVALTTLTNGDIAVSSGPFRAVVPCVASDMLVNAVPDPSAYPVPHGFLDALEQAATPATDGHDRVICAGVLIRPNSAMATNGLVILETWHGVAHMPTALVPKMFIQRLTRSGKTITAFGASERTLTAWFDDGSWAKCQTYDVEFPTAASETLLNAIPWASAAPVGAAFFDAIEAVRPFCASASVYFRGSEVSSHRDSGVGAQYAMPKAQFADCAFNPDYIDLCKPFMSNVFLSTKVDNRRGDMLYFSGGNTRGVIAGLTV